MNFRTAQTLYRNALLLASVIALTLTHGRAQTPATQRPNIIFILTDDLGYGDLGVLFQKQREQNNDRSEPWMFTPHLDALASGGAVLTDHYCAAPVCAPSRASLLLGVSQGHANVRDNQFDKALEDNHTLASVLRQAGYATAAIGKWGLQGSNKWSENGDEWPAHPLNRGFDYFLGYMRHVDGHEHYPKEGGYRSPKEVWENRTEISQQLDKCFTSDLWTAAAKKWIIKKSREKRTPFFMYLAFDTPHAVLELPTQAYPEGAGLKGGLQWLGKPGHMINTASGVNDSWVHPDYASATYDADDNTATPHVPWPDTYKRYATLVRRIDSSVGDIVALLKDLDLASNTLIVFSSDNGPSLESYLPEQYVDYSPGFFNSFGAFDGVKRDVLEGGVRMPTIASWPARIPAGRVVRDASASYDWLPTFAEAAGIPVPAKSDGVSLLPSLTGHGEQLPGLVYVEYFNGGRTPEIEEFHPDHRGRKRAQMQMIRLGDYTGVRYNIESHADPFEIYNVVEDPSQVRDLAGAPGMDSLQTLMHDRVLQVRRPDAGAPRPYDDEPMPALSASATKKGLIWEAYAGDFPWIPATAGLERSARGTAETPAGDVSKKMRDGLILFHGYFRVPQTGTYKFYVGGVGDGLLRIHDATVFDSRDANSGHQNGVVKLEAGLHPFRLYFLRSAGESSSLRFQWEAPGIQRGDIPAEIFRRDGGKGKR